MKNFKCPQKMCFCRFDITLRLRKKSKVVGHPSDVEHQRRLMKLKMVDRLMPMIGRLFLESKRIVCSAQPSMKPANLVVAVWPVFELVDRLAIVIPCELKIGKFTVDVPTDFEG